MTFLIFVMTFVTLACLGVPLVTLAVFAILGEPKPVDDVDQLDHGVNGEAPRLAENDVRRDPAGGPIALSRPRV